jgi:hypothetical protein
LGPFFPREIMPKESKVNLSSMKDPERGEIVKEVSITF